MASVFIDEHGASLHKDHDELVIKKDDQEIARVRFGDIESLVFVTNAGISSAVIEELLVRGIDCVFLSWHGNLLGRLQARGGVSVGLRSVQFERGRDAAFCLDVSKAFVRGKLQNMRAFLLRMGRKRDSEGLRAAGQSVAASLDASTRAATLDELRGHEGAAARAYFGVFDQLLILDTWEFDHRTRRPPRDPVNALLSFCYALLENVVEVGVAAAGLDTYEGFYHVEAPARPALVLDMMEEMRPVIADSCVVYMLNRGQLSPQHFMTEGDGVWLTEEGRAIVFRSFERRVRGLVRHADATGPVPMGRICALQAARLARAIRGDAPYEPYTVR